MTLPDLYKEHQALDLQMAECLRGKQLIHEEICRKEQAAFVPGPSHLTQRL